MTGPAAGWLAGERLHLQHGPIDLVIKADGPAEEVTAAYRAAWAAFHPVLDDLVAVLPLLRTPVADLVGGSADADRSRQRPPPLRGEGPGERSAASLSVPGAPARVSPPSERDRTASLPDHLARAIRPDSPAARMIAAAALHAPVFVTPMAGVAGAVADHVLAAMVAGRRLERAYVDNGGDAALWLAPGATLTVAGGTDLSARIRVCEPSPVRGIATSGWRGRSHSLGIADAVTVLARTAVEADVAATLIANAVDLPGHPAVTRRPACELAAESDLGARPVTIAVDPLAPTEIARALAGGRAVARRMRARGVISGAALWLAGECVTVGNDCSATPPVASNRA